MTVKSLPLLLLPLGIVACEPEPEESNNQCDTWYADIDGDGFGDADSAVQVCSADQDTTGLVDNDDDCDDLEPTINPDGQEVCDLTGFDEDCDGGANDADPDFLDGQRTWLDADGDGYGDPGSAVLLRCEVLPGRAANPNDCNDSDNSTFPGAAFFESETRCMTDADLDGYGSVTPASGAFAGTDCNDSNPLAFPLAEEVLDDPQGIDHDCGGETEDWFVFEDFELGAPNPRVTSALNSTEITDEFAHSGQYSVKMKAFTVLNLKEIDTSRRLDPTTGEVIDGCANFAWSMRVKRGPGAPTTRQRRINRVFTPVDELITVEAWDGVEFDDVATIVGDGTVDDEFIEYGGFIQSERAYRKDFRMRIIASDFVAVDPEVAFYIDDIRLACTGVDRDGDGIGENQDCDDTDPRHWADCGLCVDKDDDGFGDLCDLGEDCDDDDAGRAPGLDDFRPDGTDQNCDGIDGPGHFDDFEDGETDTDVWNQPISGAWNHRSDIAANGLWAIGLEGGTTAEMNELNMVPCDQIGWALNVRRGPDFPDNGDTVRIEYTNGPEWRTAFSLNGGQVDGSFLTFRGILAADEFSTVENEVNIIDPEAFWVGFQARLATGGDNRDEWVVDDIGVGCNPVDTDGDGFWSGLQDCDDESRAHWADCGRCVDNDGDDYGEDCDLGDDCDDKNPAINPGAFDELGDGVDTDCNGFDGPGIVDDFNDGENDDAVWAVNAGTIYDRFTVQEGNFSLRFDSTDEIVSVFANMEPCESVEYDYWGRNTGIDAGEAFYFEIFNGTDWVCKERYAGGSWQSSFQNYQGYLFGDEVIQDRFRARFRSTANSTFDYYYLDDVSITCGPPNTDGDPAIDDDDCAVNDELHWADCGQCTDGDLDGYGEDCDLGPDCDDSDAGVNPSIAEIDADETDQNCDGYDSVQVITDRFETCDFDALTWPSVVGTPYPTTEDFVSAPYSAVLTGGSRITSKTIDTSACSLIVWQMQARRPSRRIDSDDELFLYYDDGAGFVETFELVGGPFDSEFIEYSGTITDPAAFHPGFRVEMWVDASSFDEVWIDDFSVGCAVDRDGDGFAGPLDCNDKDDRHWSDCGLCVDWDDDGYGELCDLGPDCDDTIATTFPGAPDAFGNGIDDDCSGVDGQGIYANFDNGTILPGFDYLDDNDASPAQALVETEFSFSGGYSLQLGGDQSFAYALPIDIAGCTELAWEWQVLRGSDNAPESADFVRIEADDSGFWTELQTINGVSAMETEFTRYFGSTTDPLFLVDDLAVRLYADGSGLNFDDFLVDDFVIGCDDDTDGLASAAEISIYGTEPFVDDTDTDGLSDGDEVNIDGTDPTRADTDGDGLNDGVEVITYQTDPLDTDTDGDGFDDATEVADGSDPLDENDPIPNPVP